MRKNNFAFTLGEILIVITILGILATLTTVSTISSDKTRAKKLVIQSNSFYTELENVYLQIVTNHTNTMSIKTLKDINEDSEVDSSDMLQLLVKYMDGQNFPTAPGSCNNRMVVASVLSDYLEGMKCAEFPPDITVGVKYDPTCTTTVDYKEYLDEEDYYKKSSDISTKTATDVCGYVMYETRGSIGVLGKDVFIVPLGQRRVK